MKRSKSSHARPRAWQTTAYVTCRNAKQAFCNPRCFRYPAHGGLGLKFDFASVPEAAEYAEKLPNANRKGYRLTRSDESKDWARGNLEWRPSRAAKKAA